MFLRKIFFILPLCLSFFYLSLSKANSLANPEKTRHRYILNLNQEFRQDNNNTKDNFLFQNLTGFGVGFGIDDYNLIFEKSQFSEASGNSTLNVKRIYETYSFWAQLQMNEFQWLLPFFTAGFGIAKDRVETDLLGTKTERGSEQHPMAGLGCGLRASVSWLWLSAETRLVYGEGWNPTPSIYLVGRIGLFFE